MAVKKDSRTVEEAADTKLLDSSKEEPQKTAERVTMVYIGPSLPAGWLKSNQVFTGTMTEIEKGLKDVLEKYPAVRRLLIPVEQLADKKEKARTLGNILNKYYADIFSDIAAHERKV